MTDYQNNRSPNRRTPTNHTPGVSAFLKQMERKMREEFIKDEHLEYLDDLRESGETNMFGAKPYLLDEFMDIEKEQASKILKYWMETFGDPTR